MHHVPGVDQYPQLGVHTLFSFDGSIALGTHFRLYNFPFWCYDSFVNPQKLEGLGGYLSLLAYALALLRDQYLPSG